MQTILQAKDYTVELAYADNNSDTQIEQVKAMLDDPRRFAGTNVNGGK